jgi:lipopolysaccharide transport system permease protein
MELLLLLNAPQPNQKCFCVRYFEPFASPCQPKAIAVVFSNNLLYLTKLILKDCFPVTSTHKPLRLRDAFWGVFSSFWLNRSLVGQLVRRDFEGRFRGSLLGLLWSLITPLFLLLVYTFVFSAVFKARWSADISSPASFAVVLFSGLITFNIFAENFQAAPQMVLRHTSYIKKVVFPLEVLPWVGLFSGLINAGISSYLLLIFYLLLIGIPSATVLYLPIIVLPLCLSTLGAVWFISSLGVFLRDLQHGAGLVTTVFMFLCPIFYPLSAVPERVRQIVFLNPLTPVIEMIRGALFFDTAPPFRMLLVSILVSWGIAALGYWWFMRTKKGFADVV